MEFLPFTYFLCADGACSGNPGPGGYAWELWEDTITEGQEIGAGAGSSVETTNNIMELRAAIDGLTEVRDLIIAGQIQTPCVVKLRFDSEYVLKGIFEWMAGWKAKGWTKKGGLKNAELWKDLDAIIEDIKWRNTTLEADWVKGHAGDMGNERVDTKAVQMRDLAAADARGETQDEPAPIAPSAPTSAPAAPAAAKVVEYIVMEGQTVVELDREVNDCIAKGWTPQGGICFAPGHNTSGRFYQALVR